MTDNKNAKSPSHKGKPSGTGKEGSGLKEAQAENLEKDKEIADKYTDETERPSPNVHERHPNRNTDKGRENQGEDSSSI